MKTVIVVDDQRSHREMISNLLKGSGINVIEASDGAEAMDKIEVNFPDLVILDIVMPGMNGFEVCRKLKNNPITKDIPVVFCSIKGEEFDRYWGIKQGADAYIAKPFGPRELLGTVKQFLRS